MKPWRVVSLGITIPVGKLESPGSSGLAAIPGEVPNFVAIVAPLSITWLNIIAKLTHLCTDFIKLSG